MSNIHVGNDGLAKSIEDALNEVMRGIDLNVIHVLATQHTLRTIRDSLMSTPLNRILSLDRLTHIVFEASDPEGTNSGDVCFQFGFTVMKTIKAHVRDPIDPTYVVPQLLLACRETIDTHDAAMVLTELRNGWKASHYHELRQLEEEVVGLLNMRPKLRGTDRGVRTANVNMIPEVLQALHDEIMDPRSAEPSRPLQHAEAEGKHETKLGDEDQIPKEGKTGHGKTVEEEEDDSDSDGGCKLAEEPMEAKKKEYEVSEHSQCGDSGNDKDMDDGENSEYDDSAESTLDSESDSARPGTNTATQSTGTSSASHSTSATAAGSSHESHANSRAGSGLGQGNRTNHFNVQQWTRGEDQSLRELWLDRKGRSRAQMVQAHLTNTGKARTWQSMRQQIKKDPPTRD